MAAQRDDNRLTQTLLTCEHLDHHAGRRRGFTLVPLSQYEQGKDADDDRGEVFVYVCPACAPLLAGLGRVAVAPLPSSGG